MVYDVDGFVECNNREFCTTDTSLREANLYRGCCYFSIVFSVSSDSYALLLLWFVVYVTFFCYFLPKTAGGGITHRSKSSIASVVPNSVCFVTDTRMERKTPQEVARENRFNLSKELLEETVELLNKMENSLRFLIQDINVRLAMDQTSELLGEKRILIEKLEMCISISSP